MSEAKTTFPRQTQTIFETNTAQSFGHSPSRKQKPHRNNLASTNFASTNKPRFSGVINRTEVERGDYLIEGENATQGFYDPGRSLFYLLQVHPFFVFLSYSSYRQVINMLQTVFGTQKMPKELKRRLNFLRASRMGLESLGGGDQVDSLTKPLRRACTPLLVRLVRFQEVVLGQVGRKTKRKLKRKKRKKIT